MINRGTRKNDYNLALFCRPTSTLLFSNFVLIFFFVVSFGAANIIYWLCLSFCQRFVCPSIDRSMCRRLWFIPWLLTGRARICRTYSSIRCVVVYVDDGIQIKTYCKFFCTNVFFLSSSSCFAHRWSTYYLSNGNVSYDIIFFCMKLTKVDQRFFPSIRREVDTFSVFHLTINVTSLFSSFSTAYPLVGWSMRIFKMIVWQSAQYYPVIESLVYNNYNNDQQVSSPSSQRSIADKMMMVGAYWNHLPPGTIMNCNYLEQL